MTDPDLVHFVNAQTKIYEQVVRELTGGAKRTHWMVHISAIGRPGAQRHGTALCHT